MSALRTIGPAFHRGVDLVAGAVEEAGVDEHDPVAGRVDAGGEVERGAPLLVHQADLERVRAASPRSASTRANSATVKRHLVGPVLLRLDDVDRSGAAVAARRRRAQVVAAPPAR